MVTIIDYEIGNLTSIKNMLKKIGEDSVITSDPEKIADAQKIILPGVGFFEYGINKLRSMDYFNILENKVLEEKTPTLGLCLGAQLMLDSSEEGSNCKGLGWVKGKVVRFDETQLVPGEKIPHMGWNEVEILKESKLCSDMKQYSRFYFVHSYYMICDEDNDKLLQTKYGTPFISGFEHNNIMGVQFHPEKSHKFGMKLLDNFIKKY